MSLSLLERGERVGGLWWLLWGFGKGCGDDWTWHGRIGERKGVVVWLIVCNLNKRQCLKENEIMEKTVKISAATVTKIAE